MARKYGKNATTRSNVLKLVKALLAFADGKIQVPREKLKATFKVEWIKENELLVSGKIQQKRYNKSQTVENGITKEDLWVLVECAGEVLEFPPPKDEKIVDHSQRRADVVQDIFDCLKELELLEDKRAAKNTAYWKFHLKLKDEHAGIENLTIIEEQWKSKIGAIAAEASHEVVVTKNKSPDWRGICGQMLAEQKQLTTNAFTNADGVNLQREEIYVPLAIVERKPPKPQSRNPQEEKEEEKLIPIAEEHFFEEVLRSGRSEISQGRKIAVIGEPGSGKTTRLQKIADWILEQGLGLPIWVSLADLTQPTIAQYIEEFWLKQTGQSLTIEALTQQKDQIWLLLDGVDEMTSRVETRHVSALLGGWLQGVRVVVSCRVNVWEADKNAFSGFDVFRNLEFSPEQMRDYIRCWFAGAGDVATGEDLDRELSQSENYRLKELIQNPLRLWMLCHIWYRNRGGLPETQAELYGQFVDRVYDWKADEEILDQREAIDTALAKLALAAMEQQDEVSRFRLRESWVVKKLGSRQIFEAVKRLGWLNRVERSPEAICVFYHATFQEYFAALGVEDWDYFLPRDHESSPVEEREYRIFEPQWKQVILLWLGREDIADTEKEEFIKKLVSFDDGCGQGDFEQVDKGFYEYRAYFLAAIGIDEFKACSLGNRIVQQIVKWGFGYFNIEKQEWQTFINPIKEGARKTISETIRQLAITKLTDILEHCPSESIHCQSAESLGAIDQGNPHAIPALIRILETTEDKKNRLQAVNSLNRIIAQGNLQAIAALIKILETTENINIYSLVVFSLDRIAQGNLQAIAALIKILETTENKSTPGWAVSSLGKIGQGNPQVIAVLSGILETTENEDTRIQVANSLGEIDRGNPQAIAALVKILETTKDKDNLWQAISSLGEIDPRNPQAITTLIKILRTTKSESILGLAAGILGKIGRGNIRAIAALIRILKITEDKLTRGQAVSSLGEIGQGSPHAITVLSRILETTENKSTRGRAASSLGKIGQGNPQVIAALSRILKTTKDEDTRIQSAHILGEIDLGNPQAIAALSRILETTKDEDILCWAGYNLGKTDPRNPQVIATLIKILETTQNKSTRWKAAYSLQKILSTPEQCKRVISVLKDCLGDEVYQNNFDRFHQCHKVLWECAANLPYPDFYHAWHSPPE